MVTPSSAMQAYALVTTRLSLMRRRRLIDIHVMRITQAYARALETHGCYDSQLFYELWYGA